MRIKQGMTFNGWSPYLGLLLFIIGIVFLIAAFHSAPVMAIPAAILSFFGLVIFMNIQGTEIDINQRRCRLYRDLIILRIGHWIPLSHFDRVTITRYREQFSHSVGRDLGRTAHVRTFFVAMRGERIAVHLNEVEDRQTAIALGTQVAELIGLELDDRSALPVPRPDRRR